MRCLFKLTVIYFAILVASLLEGCQSPNQSSEGGKGGEGGGIIGVESPAPTAPTPTPESTQGTVQGETTTVTIDTPTTSVEEGQSIPFTAIVSGFTGIPRFEWYIDGQIIPEAIQTINRFFPAGSHLVEVKVFDEQNRFLGSATRVMDALVAGQLPPLPLPAPEPMPTPTAEPVPTEITFSPNCLGTNMAAFKTSANNLLTRSSFTFPLLAPKNINPICPVPPGAIPTGTVINAAAIFRDPTAPQQTLIEISVKGIELPAGVIVEGNTHLSWTFHYHASVDMMNGVVIYLGRLIKDSADPSRYRITPNFTADLRGKTLHIKAVLHEIAAFGTIFNIYTIPYNTSLDGGGGTQVENHTIFSGGIFIP